MKWTRITQFLYGSKSGRNGQPCRMGNTKKTTTKMRPRWFKRERSFAHHLQRIRLQRAGFRYERWKTKGSDILNLFIASKVKRSKEITSWICFIFQRRNIKKNYVLNLFPRWKIKENVSWICFIPQRSKIKENYVMNLFCIPEVKGKWLDLKINLLLQWGFQ